MYEVKLTPRFRENNEKLASMGVTEVASTGILPKAGSESTNQPPKHDLVIDNLDRPTALRIAHALVIALDAPPEDTDTDLALKWENIGESMERSRQEEPIVFNKAPVNGRYNVLIGESHLGKFTIQADIREEASEEITQQYRRELNTAYKKVLNQIELDPTAVQDENTEESIARVAVPVQRSLGRGVAGLFKRDERDQREHERARDSAQAHLYVRLCDVEIENGADQAKIMDLWKNRNSDPIAFMDLFLHVVSESQSPPINKEFPRTKLVDLSTNASMSPLELRREQEEVAIERFLKVGFRKRGVEHRFQFAESEQEKLKLRFAAWLLDQPFMAPCRKSIKIVLDDNRRKGDRAIRETDLLPNEVIFEEIYKQIAHSHEVHQQNQPGIDGKVPYDLSKSNHLEAFQAKKRFLKASGIMVLHILYDRDVSGYLKPVEK